MSIQEFGAGPESDTALVVRALSVKPAKFKARVEKLGVSAPGAHVEFSYRSTFDGSLVQVDGVMKKITRGVGVVNVKVDGLWFAVPAGTLVTVETGEIR